MLIFYEGLFFIKITRARPADESPSQPRALTDKREKGFDKLSRSDGDKYLFTVIKVGSGLLLLAATDLLKKRINKQENATNTPERHTTGVWQVCAPP
jgi:hypothetical protein